MSARRPASSDDGIIKAHRASLFSQRLGALIARSYPLRDGRTQERSAPTQLRAHCFSDGLLWIVLVECPECLAFFLRKVFQSKSRDSKIVRFSLNFDRLGPSPIFCAITGCPCKFFATDFEGVWTMTQGNIKRPPGRNSLALRWLHPCGSA